MHAYKHTKVHAHLMNPKVNTQCMPCKQLYACMCGQMGPEVCMNDSCDSILLTGVSGEMV